MSYVLLIEVFFCLNLILPFIINYSLLFKLLGGKCQNDLVIHKLSDVTLQGSDYRTY